MTGTEKHFEELERQKEIRKTLEKNLSQVKSLPWEQFDNVDSAEIPKALDLVHVLHNDVYEYPFIQLTGAEKKRVKRPSLFLNNGLNAISVFYGEAHTKEITTEDGSGKVEIITTSKTIPRYVRTILDYLFGTITFQNNSMYLINDKQFQLLSEFEVSRRYKVGGKGNKFSTHELLEIIKFIHAHLKLKPIKEIKTAVIACNDFQLDLQTKKLIPDRAIQENETYFKVFDCDWREVMDCSKNYDDYLDMVIDDPDSLHNAKLQPVYTMLVACREITKSRFFISKSGVRTGKGLRHKIIRSVFETKDIDLDTLKGKMSDFAWASYDGGEMLLVTEAGEINRELERYLKILATESKRPARSIGQNYAEVNLTGVLAVDSNEAVLLSSDMNSRAVNIAFKDRPKGESDKERESIFKPYWETFTEQTKESASRTAKTTAGVAALLHSFLYWKTEKYQFSFKAVEMNNFNNDTFEFDDVQVFILEERSKGLDVIYYGDYPELVRLLKETYQGRNKVELRRRALFNIGWKQANRKVFMKNEQRYTSKKAFVISNANRAGKAMTAYLESLMDSSKPHPP
ncbi:hypothetical protein ACI1TC_08465 [Lactococcus petauri]|uniref:hypothetical protein n=1 Tax=Lactococcus petauri TaxID=1940789 RepID=UPI003853AC42